MLHVRGRAEKANAVGLLGWLRAGRDAIEPTRYVSWPKSKLKDFMNKDPDLHSALKSTLADLTSSANNREEARPSIGAAAR